jgi:hypothetical protein
LHQLQQSLWSPEISYLNSLLPLRVTQPACHDRDHEVLAGVMRISHDMNAGGFLSISASQQYEFPDARDDRGSYNKSLKTNSRIHNANAANAIPIG